MIEGLWLHRNHLIMQVAVDTFTVYELWAGTWELLPSYPSVSAAKREIYSKQAAYLTAEPRARDPTHAST